MTFQIKLGDLTKKNNSLLCVGLDPDMEKMPKHLQTKSNPIFEFNKAIIDATHDLVCAYKPNIAFYEAEGIKGLDQLKKTIEYIRTKYTSIPVILDAKRGDIGNTAAMYAKAAFEYWQADAVTVFPHLGLDSLEPFFKYEDKLTIVLIKTSNPDSGMFQNLLVDGKLYYLQMAEEIKNWKHDNIGIFVGATYPEALKEIRSVFPNKIFLVAGIGEQGGSIEKTVKAGIDGYGGGIMINASRSALYKSSGTNFAENVRDEAKKLKNLINLYRK